MVDTLGWQTPTAGGWPRGVRVPAGSMVDRRLLPPVVPHRAFVTAADAPIGPDGFAQGIIASGTVTLSVGPSAAGTSWSLAQASVATTTGVNDSSTVAFYAQPAINAAPLLPFQVGQSPAGGGDQVGLAGIKLVTGERLYAVWSSANNGDTATLILSGIKTVLV